MSEYFASYSGSSSNNTTDSSLIEINSNDENFGQNFSSVELTDLRFYNVHDEINVNDNMNQNFTNRKKLYDNKELFYDLIEQENKIDDCDTKEEIEEISEKIVKGKEMIFNCLSYITSINEELDKIKENEKKIDDATCKLNTVIVDFNKLNKEINKEKSQEEFYTEVTVIRHSLHKIKDIFEKSIEEHKKSFEQEYDHNRKKMKALANAYGILKNTSITHTCPICLTNQVDTIILECGHTICNTCSTRLKNHCFVCRKDVVRTQQIFFN
jgi:hypothetical protein